MSEHRRRSERHPLQVKAAVVFDSADGKPVAHAQTVDLSASGAAILSSRGDLLGSVVNLLLAQPAKNAGNAPKVLKARARVVSTVRTPDMSHYRHGLSFVRSPGDELAAIEHFLSTATRSDWAAERGAKLSARVSAAKTPRAPSAESIQLGVSAALATAHRHFMELVRRFNQNPPAYSRGYTIVGVPEYSGLVWQEGKVGFTMKEISPGRNLYGEVVLRFLLSAKKSVRIAREYPAAEKLEQLLNDCGIRFDAQGRWNERGSLIETTFEFPCEVNATLTLIGQYDTGHVQMRTQNVSGFGTIQQMLSPQAIDRDSLAELTSFVLAQSAVPGPLLLRGA